MRKFILINCLIAFLSIISKESLGSHVKASTYGFNAADVTTYFQNALNSMYDTVIVDKMSENWVVRPLFINRDNLTILFERGVTIEAKLYGFPNVTDELLRLNNNKNISLVGYGCILKMQKIEYIEGEHRHCLSLNHSQNIRVEGLQLRDSGGDGIYVNGCTNVHILNCVLDNHRRQGMSVISVDGLLMEHCLITNTKGTAPQAGIDFEPNGSTEILRNIIVRNCRIENNYGGAIIMWLMANADHNIDIKVIDCYLNTSAGHNNNGIVIATRGVLKDTHVDRRGVLRDTYVDGKVLFERCYIYNYLGSGAISISKPYNSLPVTFKDCVIKNQTENSSSSGCPILLGRPDSLTNIGGINFNNVLLVDTYTNYPIYVDKKPTPAKVRDISGTMHVFSKNATPQDWWFDTTKITLNLKISNINSLPLSSLSISASPVAVYGKLGCINKSILTAKQSATRPYPMALLYSATGTAVNYDDYNFLTGCIIIPTSIFIARDTFSVRNDALIEGFESANIAAIENSIYKTTTAVSNIIIKDSCLADNVKGLKSMRTSHQNSLNDERIVVYKKISNYNESDWLKVHDSGFSTAGNFVQRNGYIENSYSPKTDTGKMFPGETGYGMRVLKGVEAQDGKVEIELQLMGYAAPSIFVPTRVTGEKHYEAYNCVIFNHSTAQKKYQGINLWVYRNGCSKVKTFNLDIPKYQKVTFAVEFVGSRLTFFFNDKKVGTYVDTNPIPKGSIGIYSIEEPNYFYNFKFTSYDSPASQVMASQDATNL